MNKWKKLWRGTMAVACIAIPALAAAYPDKPVKIVVPYSAGGSSDLIARAIGEQLGTELGQPVVVENRAGAGSMIGTAYVSGEAPDGYTLLLADVPFTIVPALYGDRVKYDARKDFAPIALVGLSPMYLFASPAYAGKGVAELVADAKKRPGVVSIGSGGNGSLTHLLAELFMLNTQTKLVHVPYKGAAASVSDLAGGQIDVSFSSMPSAAALFQAGKIRPLAVSSPQRQPGTPDVPTFQESGLPNLTVQSWWGLLAPAGTPQAVLDKLGAAMAKVMQSPAIGQRYAGIGANVPDQADAGALQALLSADFQRWQDVVTRAGINLE
ncbi:tripartite tricarboxylate transporter substrate binding protein [Bordetella sp. BOR01]|uniref:Bug family tripartite tricarboxylate transporter substrate binding protein n=1 Tax=Bordetella sp. BOR01 TaxID=2854779 RepID=UPI001C46CEB8|nr:tripartite tricarboxylate transporter substrate binding protein [Bordetella sp. BOR01]MBV7486690.1 tripartite tricarboxylate transporter substrate binding protein [Bordetella sp. BOR01]